MRTGRVAAAAVGLVGVLGVAAALASLGVVGSSTAGSDLRIDVQLRLKSIDGLANPANPNKRWSLNLSIAPTTPGEFIMLDQEQESELLASIDAQLTTEGFGYGNGLVTVGGRDVFDTQTIQAFDWLLPAHDSIPESDRCGRHQAWNRARHA